MKRFELSTLSLARMLYHWLHPQVCLECVPQDQKIMHYGGADGQFPPQALDDARAVQTIHALDSRRQFSDSSP